MAANDYDFRLPIFNWVQRRTHGRFDPVTPFCLLLLAVIGIFFIYSAQLYHGRSAGDLFLLLLRNPPWRWPVPPPYFMQILWMGIGAAAYFVVSHIDYKIFLKHGHWVWIAAMLGLVAVKIDGIGQERLGAQRWIDLGPVSVQPSEPAKLAVVVMCASILARSRIRTVRDSLFTLGKLALAAGLPMLLILAQPDLGSALVIPPMVFSLLYASNLSKRFFAASFVAFAVIVSVVGFDTFRYSKFMTENNLSFNRDRGAYAPHTWVPLHDYQRNRILAFAAPDKVDPSGTNISWNLNQSLITVGSGGLTGKGWAQGTQARLGYLPRAVAHNDFIFSVLAEETGFLGSVFVLGLFGLVLANGVRIAGMARDRFGTLLALGVTIVFAMHVFVNIGMTIGLVPITGLPLPFLSYGGSFLLSCCVLQGFVQSVYRFRREF